MYDIARLAPCQQAWRDYLGGSLLPKFMAHAAARAADGTPGAAPAAPRISFSFATNATGGLPGEVSMGTRLLRPLILQAAGFFGDWETEVSQQIELYA